MFCAQISGEHLQDHWSSGLSFFSYNANFSLFKTVASVQDLRHKKSDPKSDLLQFTASHISALSQENLALGFPTSSDAKLACIHSYRSKLEA